MTTRETTSVSYGVHGVYGIITRVPLVGTVWIKKLGKPLKSLRKLV